MNIEVIAVRFRIDIYSQMNLTLWVKFEKVSCLYTHRIS